MKNYEEQIPKFTNPAMKLNDIKESSTPVKLLSDIKFVKFERNTAVFKIGSGRYKFESKLSQK